MYNTIVEGKRLCVLTAYPTKQEDQNWLLWWGCDNDGAQPIIRPDGDYNPLNFTLTFAPNTPEVFMNKEKQMVGNGCLYYLDKDDPIAFGNANLVTTTPFDMNKLNFGLFMYLEDTTSRLSFNISGGNGNGAVMVRLFYDETGVNQYLQLRDKVNNVWAYAFPSAVFQLKTYYFINFIIDNSGDKVVVKLYINNVEHVSSQEWPHFELGNATGSSVGIVNSYADQLMITKDITKDLYALRGFDKFTSELPPEPATPADNIIFWWSGVSNKYGLPAMRHYPNADEDGGQDYIYTGFPDAFVLEDASFSGYERLYPKQIVSNTSPPDSEFNASMTFSVGDVADNAAMVFKTNTTFTQGRIGYWIKYSGQNHAQFILSDYTTYPYPVLTFGIETSITEETKLLLGVRRDPVHIGYGIESTSFSFEENTWYFIEAELSSEMKIYVNGVNIEVSDIISFDTTINLAYVIIGAEDGYKYVQNIMISTDPSINFYEKGYHLLTEYPKLTGSDLLFYHVERLMNTFRGL
jgi:hypothetical protein